MLASCATQNFVHGPKLPNTILPRPGILHITSIQEVLPLLESLDERDLVVWDIDQVILTLKQMFWRPNAESIERKLIEKYTALYGPQKIRDAKARLIIGAEEELLDPLVKNIIKNLQARKIPTIALTAWGVQPYSTIEQPLLFRSDVLRRHGVVFNSFRDLAPKNWDDNMGFQHGIIGSGKASKGQALERFLEYARFRPRTIVVIDDRERNVQSMHAACIKAGTEKCYGYQYEAEIYTRDPMPNPCLMRVQLEAALEGSPILTDQEILNNIEHGSIKCTEADRVQP